MFWENSPKHQGEAISSLARSMAIIKMSPDIPDDKWNHIDEQKYGIGKGMTSLISLTLYLILSLSFHSPTFRIVLSIISDRYIESREHTTLSLCQKWWNAS
jgi:hypothetical protein